MKNQYKIGLLLLIFGVLSNPAIAQQSEILDGAYWKNQGLTKVMPAWIHNGIDSTDGQFHAYMDRKWNSYKDNLKYPGMMSRHLFSLSVAYMLGGNKNYLDRADHLFSYLLEYGWDKEYGGWYYAINPAGEAVDSKKDLFMNIYAITGLSMYYMVTHNKRALRYTERSRELLKKRAWDSKSGGYYKTLDRQWQVTDSRKVFTPQVAPVSGYLLYLYAATKDEQYLTDAKQLMDLVENRIQDDKTGWIREKFDASWNPIPENKDDEQMDIGHNIEVSWMWMRLYGITGDESYKGKSLALYSNLKNHAFSTSGAWLHKMNLSNTNKHRQTTPWWIQAYGNMLQLPIHYYGNVPGSLDRFKRGADFWNKAFLDQEYGSTMLSATLDGEIDRGDKAVRSKTSYHAMEHSMLNYLYLNLLIHDEPVTLYFHFDEDSDGRPLCPLPIYDEEAQITAASVNGKSLKIDNPANPCIEIAPDNSNSVKITIK